jgi:hypothetical protein
MFIVALKGGEEVLQRFLACGFFRPHSNENDAAPQSSVLNEYGLLVPENERTTVEKRVFCFGLNGEGISFLPATPGKKHQFAGLVLLQCRA